MLPVGKTAPVPAYTDVEGDVQQQLQLLSVRQPSCVRANRVVVQILRLDIEVRAALGTIQAEVELLDQRSNTPVKQKPRLGPGLCVGS